MILNNHVKIGIAILIVLLIGYNFLTKNSHADYTGDLVPINKEIENISGYEKATLMILKNLDRINYELHHPSETPKDFAYEDFKSFSQRKYSIIDSILKIEKDSLKLRFLAYNAKIEGADTTITFNPSAADFSMRGNNKDEDACCTLFTHSIFYTTKPIKAFKNEEDANDTPSAVIKINNNYYYIISSRLEY